MLPLAWIGDMEGKQLPSQALLRDRYGNMWAVELGNDEGKTYFLAGWPGFVKQNYLEMGDLLIFKYDGGHFFDVKICGHDSCDKRGVGRLIYKIKLEQEEEEPTDGNAQEETLGIDILDDVNQNVSTQPMNSPCSSEIIRGEGAENGPRRWKTKRLVDPFGDDIFSSGIVPKPENPHFVAKVNKRRQYGLFVPSEIIKVYSLELPEETFLRDPQGKEWKTSLSIWDDGRSHYCGGWKALCRTNLIGKDDLCICEFKTCEERGLYIQVHLVPRQA
ncbi:OLC1v1035812C1 [Oldenlandia corymbosa var. corymbosa]|uniref:OLC1v1035812C1 n=1 Tax=Oldenlandia corymbosa var. corymbosa TaxID=529605 RepID=A0AAV1CUZ6_OLDCO|nr:OLC1v1035812C1 [Oldenlandia corymbosa var. corymbosa]